MPERSLVVDCERDWLVVDFHLQVVVHGFLGGKLQAEVDRLGLRGVVAEGVVSGKLDRIGAVPKQSFLPGIKMKVNVDAAGFERQGNLALHLVVVND